MSKLLGHKSITITADIYGHLIGTVASDAVNGHILTVDAGLTAA